MFVRLIIPKKGYANAEKGVWYRFQKCLTFAESNFKQLQTDYSLSFLRSRVNMISGIV